MGDSKFQAIPGAIIVWGDDSANQIRDIPPGNKFARIASGGGDQSLAIDEDGKLTLWSTFLPGTKGTVVLTDVPDGHKAIDAVLAPTHGCAILENGGLHTFGHFAGKTPPQREPTPPLGLIANKDLATAGHCVAAGGDFLVVIANNEELCQWKTGSTKTFVPPGKFKKVAARNDYTIALSKEGSLYGWGPPFDALLHAPSGKNYLKGWEVIITDDGFTYYYLEGPTENQYVDLAAGNVRKPAKTLTPAPIVDLVPHFLALHSSGTVSGWGKDTQGEAQGAPAGVKFQAIAAGNSYSIGLDTHGYLHHWGDPVALMTAVFPAPVPNPYPLSTVPKGRFKSIGAASQHAAAVQDVSPSVLSLLVRQIWQRLRRFPIPDGP